MHKAHHQVYETLQIKEAFTTSDFGGVGLLPAPSVRNELGPRRVQQPCVKNCGAAPYFRYTALTAKPEILRGLRP